jgi:hypothetical protein
MLFLYIDRVVSIVNFTFHSPYAVDPWTGTTEWIAVPDVSDLDCRQDSHVLILRIGNFELEFLRRAVYFSPLERITQKLFTKKQLGHIEPGRW